MATSKSLMVLSLEYKELADRLASMVDGDDGEAITMMQDTLEAERYPIEQKVAAIAYWDQQESMLAESIKQDIERQKDRLARIKRHQEERQKYLLACFEINGLKKIETQSNVISIRRLKPSVEVTDEAAIPAEFMRIPPAPAPKPDKTAIADAITAGQIVPGCDLVQRSKVYIK